MLGFPDSAVTSTITNLRDQRSTSELLNPVLSRKGSNALLSNQTINSKVMYYNPAKKPENMRRIKKKFPFHY